MASLVVFSDDWGRHPSSCQHLVQRLLPHYEVLWVNTIGTRAPQLDLASFSRALAKASQWASWARTTQNVSHPNNLRVQNPLMWPWFRRTFDRWVNCRLLCHSLSQSIDRLSRPRCAITTIPVVSDLIGRIDVDQWIYYCVDDLASWPGLDRPALQQMEQALVRNADRCVTVSRRLQDQLKSKGRDAKLLTHGVDLEFWRKGSSNPGDSLAANEVESPRMVFWGLIDERLNAKWLLKLADRMTRGTILLVGPVQFVEPELEKHPRVRLPGPVAYSGLPNVAQQADVLIMPYRDIPATQAMQPLKLKEYLATGLPCVVSPLPAVDEWRDCLDIVEDANEFASTVVDRINIGIPATQVQARHRLSEEDWSSKAERFRAVIEEQFGCIKPFKTIP